MADVLELEDLRQQVASLSRQQMELQATILRLKEEKHLLEANLQTERSGFAEEKLQLTSLLTSLQNSVMELSQAKENLEQESRAQDELLNGQVSTLTAEMAKLTSLLHQKDQELLALQQQVEAERIQRGRLAEDLQRKEQVSKEAMQELSLQVDQLNNRLKQSSEKLAQVELVGREEYNKAAQEKELAVLQLQEKKAELSALTRQLRSLEERQGASAAEAQREKAELSQKVQELDARILTLTAQCQQSEAQAAALPALRGQLRDAQQKLADKEKLVEENKRLQEQPLLILEESVRNTEGILEEEKRQAAELSVLTKREEELCKDLRSWQEKTLQKEQLLLAWQQERAGAQALIGELMPIKRLYQELQVEHASLENKYREKMEQVQKVTDSLQAELTRTKLELSEMASLRERFLEQERSIQQLQAEKANYTEQLATLQQAHTQLTEENRVLSERLQCLEAELGDAKQKYAQELEAARLDSENVVAVSRREVEEAQKKLEAVTNKYEEAKQKLLVQMHEEELQVEVKHQNEKMAELQAQFAQKEQAADHYKAQMEKAKVHYVAKKQQNQELMEKLKGLEQLEKENTELKAESDRLVRELQQAALQVKESELHTKNLTIQVKSLEAQVEFADRQLRERGKSVTKRHETFRQSPADISTDSLDMSTNDEGPPLNSSSKKTQQSLSESAEPSKTSHPLPRKVESLESHHFTPIPTHARSQAENIIGSAADISFRSRWKTLSARQRTTQDINIPLTKRQGEQEALSSANAFFLSVPSAGSQASAPSQEPVKTRLHSAAASSSRSLASLPSQESLTLLGASPEDKAGNTTLMSPPGYQRATRSSTRQSQYEGASTGRSSFYMGTCQAEPDPLADWNRIAELQQRNRVCPPHLKTSYPLESRPSQSLSTITDEEMKTGDPKETLRKASMLPTQIARGRTTRRSTLVSSSATGGVATRQQRKRRSSESQQSPGTPESKKSASCFPQPQIPKGRQEERKHSTLAGSKKSRAQPDEQTKIRQPLAFSILNTPKKLGNSLLRRRPNRKVTTSKTPRSGSRRSPRTPTSPEGKASAGTAGPSECATAQLQQAGKLQVAEEPQAVYVSLEGEQQGTNTPQQQPLPAESLAISTPPCSPAPSTLPANLDKVGD